MTTRIFLEWATAADAAAFARDFSERPFLDTGERVKRQAPEYLKDDVVFGVILDCYAVLHAPGGLPLPAEVLEDIDAHYGVDERVDGMPGEWRKDKPSKANGNNTARALAKQNPEAIIASVVIIRHPKGGYSGAVAFRLWDRVKVVPFRPANYLQGLRRVCQSNKDRKVIVRHWAGFGVERMKQEGFDARAWKSPDGDARSAGNAARAGAGIVKENRKARRAGGKQR